MCHFKYISYRKILPSLKSLLMVILCGYATTALASNCYYNSGFSDKTINMSVDSIIAQRDMPVGSVVYEKKITFYPPSTYIFTCKDSARTWYYSSRSNAVKTPGYPVGYYETGVPGYSIVVHSGDNKNAAAYRSPALEIPSTGGASESVFAQADLTTMYLVIYKTASNTSSGPIKVGKYAEFSTDKLGGGWIYPITLNITGGTITTTACSLVSTSINVPLDDVFDIKFTGVTTGDKGFDIGLTCDKDAKINVSLAGTQNSDTTDTSVLALTNAGQSGTATGVGIQLLYGGVPLKINNNILLKTSAGGQETLQFTARYYQTNKLVTPGKANSNATLNITYQ